jgi:hypothetical protein
MTNEDDDVLVQADFTGTVTLNVFDLSSSTPTTAAFTATRTLANVVFNSLQPWTLDPDGYNLGDTITTNELAREGGHQYRIEYLLHHVTDGLYAVAFEVRAEPLLSS